MPRPGPWLAWVLVAGVALGVAGDIAAVLAWAAALAGASVALGVEPRTMAGPGPGTVAGPGRGRVRRLALLAALVCAAVGHGAAARDRALAPPLGAWFDAQVSAARADGPIDVIGAVAEDAAVVDDAVRLVVAASRLCDGAGECWPVGGTVQLRVTGAAAPAAAPAWTAGRAVRVPALLRQPDVHLNPGGPGETWQRLHRTADFVGTVKSAALLAIEPGPPWAEAAAAARRYVRRVAATYLAPHAPQSAAILAAILIGDRTGLDDDVVRELQAAGTYHVIAISGGNVALLATLCTVLLRLCLRSFRATAVVTTAIVVAYGWLVGSSASVDRAVLAASLYLTTSLVGLRPDGTAVLGLTALVLAIVDPPVTVDVGAWLSFGASLSIVIAAGRFMRWARGHAGASRSSRPARTSWIERAIWHPALALFSATLAAELALAPVAAAVFGRVGIAGLVLNFLAIPAMSLVEIAGFITMGLALVWDAGARVSAAVTHAGAWVLVTSADVMAVAPWMSWRVPRTPIAWTAVYYVAAWVFVSRHDRRWPRVAAGLVALAALGAIVIAPGLERARPAPGWLRVTTLDVGQGDAILVQFPTGRSLLVDAGGGPGGFDTGGRIVTPALWALGVRRLDYLIFTHPDLDHIGGAASVARDLAPHEIWEGVPVPRNEARRDADRGG